MSKWYATLFAVGAAAATTTATSHCGQGDSGERPACLDEAKTDCAPLYAPEFAEIFRRTLVPSCASSGVSCHGPMGAQGGLVFETEQGAYDALAGENGGRRRMNPGDAKCSEVMVRLDSLGHAWSMPPDAPLDERARCSIRKWIAAGSPRSGTGTP